jgi:hypothetical protein
MNFSESSWILPVVSKTIGTSVVPQALEIGEYLIIFSLYLSLAALLTMLASSSVSKCWLVTGTGHV